MVNIETKKTLKAAINSPPMPLLWCFLATARDLISAKSSQKIKQKK